MADRQTVLIVDDNGSIRATLRTVLTLEGYATREAADGVAAVEALRRSPDRLVVLLDLRMPRMSGQEVLRLIGTAQELLRHAYIVMTSDRCVLNANDAALLKRHDIPLLEKPFDLAALMRAVERAQARLFLRSSPPSPRATVPPT
jgi:two-component system response regulator MprA